jgi:hypothetical protein
MAIAVIGGLLTSTVLSLLVIPVVFTYLDDLGQWATRWLRRRPADRSGDRSGDRPVKPADAA